MDRRERRIHKKKVRRIGTVVATVAMLGATAGLSSTAGAAKTFHDSRDQQNNCGRFDNDFVTFNENPPGKGNNVSATHNCTN